ncbi:MAG: SHOCT domain-containing protein [Verrucomicrobia bacterium]|nr:SHOCT domain-containing protein [Verrucomicrobiota bacterium]MCH8510172.1 SHOCT domain-containing protein [Kiritimatiellia bacterium]
MKPPYEERNEKFRNTLRAIGFVLLPIGGVFAAIGLIDFFTAFGGSRMPTKFWCLFVGLPLVAFGVMCLQAGFLRTISGYVAGESAPVAKDTLQYVGEGMRPTIRNIANDLRGTPPEGDVATRMKTLEELRKNELISEAEYADKRAEILKHI